MPIEPFAIPDFTGELTDLRDRLARTRWPDEIPNSTWDYGFDLAFLQDICAYWRDHFDWPAQAEKLSLLPHYKFTSGADGIHFLHVRGKGPTPMPLILTHGWPGSFVEMLHILPLLTDPAMHGGDASDAFDVVIPSLPGFGFSDRPVAPGMNTFRIAALWVELMHALGYPRFAAQGGDFGAAVTTILGWRHEEHVTGIHLNYIPGSYRPHIRPGDKLTTAEAEFLVHVGHWVEDHGAYAHLQQTTPQTAAYGLNDSPAGLAAWILEKFRSWSDCDGNLLRRFTRDELLTNVSLYWLTQTANSSFRLYYEARNAPLRFNEGDFVRVPCAIAHFPREDPFPPRAWAERSYNIQRWTEMPRGGHFAAAEEPTLLAEDVRAFFRGLR